MNILKETVKQKGISYRELALEANTNCSHIGLIVNRKIQCREPLALRIAVALELDEDYGLLILGIVPDSLLNITEEKYKKGLTE
jgi:cyanate lyase